MKKPKKAGRPLIVWRLLPHDPSRRRGRVRQGEQQGMKTLLIVTLALAGQTAAQPAPAPQPTNCEKLAGVWTRDKVQDDVEYAADLTIVFVGERAAVIVGDIRIYFTVRDCEADGCGSQTDGSGGTTVDRFDISADGYLVPIRPGEQLPRRLETFTLHPAA